MRSNAKKRLSAVALLAGLLVAPALAENVDPDDDGSQYAWAENLGWLNAEPSGDGGPGLEVGEFELTGWMWGENAGWISLSCQNTASCATQTYGVSNSGGVLSGYAWGENAGWISFSGAAYGVTIDIATGELSGRAWSENAGWITFASTGYKVKSGWSCVPLVGAPLLTLTRVGPDLQLDWTPQPNATAYDLVRGELSSLRTSFGDFGAATSECLADNLPGLSASHVGNPAPGDGDWFLVRGANCGGGSWESGGISQVGLRDGEIGLSPGGCP